MCKKRGMRRGIAGGERDCRVWYVRLKCELGYTVNTSLVRVDRVSVVLI